ncbi:hypothetical protein TUE45_06626 [Streptomyces reticuli]|nr:hypothetical protein TUE45_06626 [Streptomyces reticuli]
MTAPGTLAAPGAGGNLKGRGAVSLCGSAARAGPATTDRHPHPRGALRRYARPAVFCVLRVMESMTTVVSRTAAVIMYFTGSAID